MCSECHAVCSCRSNIVDSEVFRDLYWRLQYGLPARTAAAARPGLIDLGPTPLLQTALIALAAPLLDSRFAAPTQALLTVCCQAVFSGQRRAFAGRKCYQAFASILAIFLQLSPALIASYAVLSRTMGLNLARFEKSEARRLLDQPLKSNVRTVEYDRELHIPAFCVNIQCTCCQRRKCVSYDAHGYPLYAGTHCQGRPATS